VKVYTLDPLRDERWAEFIARHPSASVFHSVPWLAAIRKTYGYKPVAYTTSSPTEPLSNAMVFCEIRSWITGRRLVSLPFSDHCEPLHDHTTSIAEIAGELGAIVAGGEWNYVEIRPRTGTPVAPAMVKSPFCYLHMLDLSPGLEEVLRRTHKTSIQQPIKRAEREGVICESGSSDKLLKDFYRLMVVTRRRHQLPPQPIEWFRQLAECMRDRLQIRVAYHKQTPIASIMTLKSGNTIVYKYGCSDTRFQNLGATPHLIWNAIVEARQEGLTVMDFGRSDADNPGLIAFKNRWGAAATEITYLRWTREKAVEKGEHAPSGALKKVFSVMPDFMLEATGRFLYRHVG
jgi:hypothetical protein